MATSGKLTLFGGGRGAPIPGPSQYLQCALYSAAAPDKTRLLARGRESGQLPQEENKFQLSFRRSSAEAYKIYLPTRAALFPSGADPFSPDNCITSHCTPRLSPIVGSLLSSLTREMPRRSFAFLPTILLVANADLFFFFSFCFFICFRDRLLEIHSLN